MTKSEKDLRDRLAALKHENAALLNRVEHLERVEHNHDAAELRRSAKLARAREFVRAGDFRRALREVGLIDGDAGRPKRQPGEIAMIAELYDRLTLGPPFERIIRWNDPEYRDNLAEAIVFHSGPHSADDIRERLDQRQRSTLAELRRELNRETTDEFGFPPVFLDEHTTGEATFDIPGDQPLSPENAISTIALYLDVSERRVRELLRASRQQTARR